MPGDAGEVGFQKNRVLYEIQACLRVFIGGATQMITLLAGLSIHEIGALCFGAEKRRAHSGMESAYCART
jgi:hypothetical protein